MKVFLIIGIILLALYASYKTYRYASLSKGLDTEMANGAVILDVRTETEFQTGHIKGSLNISLGTLRQRYKELDPNNTYITVCSHGLRSVKAADLLKERGFHKVHNGGAWSDLEKVLPQKHSEEELY